MHPLQVSAEMLQRLEAVVRVIRHRQEPWGGLRLVLCGDFSQLVRGARPLPSAL